MSLQSFITSVISEERNFNDPDSHSLKGGFWCPEIWSLLESNTAGKVAVQHQASFQERTNDQKRPEAMHKEEIFYTIENFSH